MRTVARHGRGSTGAAVQGSPTAGGYAMARRLRGYSRFWDAAAQRWAQPEQALWWAVIESSIVELALVQSPSATSRARAAASLAAWQQRHLDPLLDVCGLEPEYVVPAVWRWVRVAKLTPAAAPNGGVDR